MSQSPFLGLRTTIYRVPDIAKGKAWYSQVFKTDPYFDEVFYVGFNIAGYELGLIPDETSAPKNEGGVHTYWGVEDVKSVFKNLIALGAVSYEEPHDVGEGIVVAAVKDPWNNIVGIIYNPHFKLP